MGNAVWRLAVESPSPEERKGEHYRNRSSTERMGASEVTAKKYQQRNAAPFVPYETFYRVPVGLVFSARPERQMTDSIHKRLFSWSCNPRWVVWPPGIAGGDTGLD